MPPAEFFLPFGFLVQRSFLSEASSRVLINSIQSSEAAPAMVGDETYHRVDETIRKTSTAHVSSASLAGVRSGLDALMPRIAAHFERQISGFENPKCLTYRPGDFFQEHDDSLSGQGLPPRNVSVVIFLNDQSDFEGGRLTFYGLIDEPRWRGFGFDVVAEAGLLIAFRPDLRHEVTAVNAGSRFTIVTWYY